MIIGILLIFSFVILVTAKKASTFFVVGDYAYVMNMTDTNTIFDAMDKVIEKGAQQIDKPDYFVTVGDNIYPTNETEPSPQDF